MSRENLTKNVHKLYEKTVEFTQKKDLILNLMNPFSMCYVFVLVNFMCQLDWTIGCVSI